MSSFSISFVVCKLTRRILITGANPFDSGKTTVARTIALNLKESGYSVEYFKPLSGHNYWYRHEHTMRCIESGQIFSYDAWMIKNDIQSSHPITMINPIHNLFVPARIERPGQVIPSTLSISGWDSVLVMKRITQVMGGRTKDRLLVAIDLVQDGRVIMSIDEMMRLINSHEYIPIKSIEEAQAFQDAVYEGVLNEAFHEMEKNREIVIIESFNDSVWPWEGLDTVDTLVVVGPGQMFLYDPAKMHRAIEYVKKHHEPIRSVSVSNVSDLLRPIHRVELTPKSGFDVDILDKLIIKEPDIEEIVN